MVSSTGAGLWHRLQVRPSSGTPDLSQSSQTLEFNANTAGLPAGVYSATVTFGAEPGFSAPMTVTLSVGDPSVPCSQ